MNPGGWGEEGGGEGGISQLFRPSMLQEILVEHLRGTNLGVDQVNF